MHGLLSGRATLSFVTCYQRHVTAHPVVTGLRFTFSSSKHQSTTHSFLGATEATQCRWHDRRQNSSILVVPGLLFPPVCVRATAALPLGGRLRDAPNAFVESQRKISCALPNRKEREMLVSPSLSSPWRLQHSTKSTEGKLGVPSSIQRMLRQYYIALRPLLGKQVIASALVLARTTSKPLQNLSNASGGLGRISLSSLSSTRGQHSQNIRLDP